MLRRAILFFTVLLWAVAGWAQLNTERIMEIGRNALYFEDYVLSIQYFNQVIEAKPFLHEPYFFRGLAKYNLDDFVGAEEDLSHAIEKNPYVSRCYQLRALCRARLDSLSLAENDFRMAIKYDPQNSGLWQNLAVLCIQAGNWEKASQVIDSLLTFSPRNSGAYMLRTRVALNAGDTLLALNMADLAVKNDRFLSDAYDTRAIVHHEMGNYEAAEKDLDRALELMPTNSGSYINRALVRYYRNNLRGAMEDYDMALYVEPGSFLAHYNRGLLRMNVGDDNLAIEDFDKVLEIDPDNTLARFNRGLLRSNTGDYKGAVSDYTRVLEAYPNFEYAYQCRAVARRKISDKRGADADEKWLLKRQLDIYNNGTAAYVEEYSAENDKTRKRSDNNVRNYNKLVVSDDGYGNKYATEYRGKVQNRNVFVELEPLFVFTYYDAGSDFSRYANYDSRIEKLNKEIDGKSPLLLTNSERALSEAEVARHFGHIDDMSKLIAENDSCGRNYMLRAIDYYLVQDLESALGDIDIAVAVDDEAWELYFVRAFVRYRKLETPQQGGNDVVIHKHGGGLPDLNFRLVKDDLDRVVEIAPDFAYAYYNRANVSVKLSDFKSAIVDYTKAIELDGSMAMAYYNRGLAKIYTGNNEGGVADLSKAGELGIFHAYSVMKRFMYSAAEE